MLWALGSDACLPVNAIAKKVGLSRDGIVYRIRQWENKKVLCGTRTVIDVTTFGYSIYHVFLQLKNPAREIETEIIRRLQDLPYVRALLKFSGGYDFEIALIAKNIAEFDLYLTEIIQRTENYLQGYEILAISKSFIGGTFLQSFAKGLQEKNLHNEVQQKKKIYIFDKKDLEILKIIRDDARLPLLKISSRVKISPDAVSYRLKKMEKAGTILRYVPVINYAALGYRITVLLAQISNLDCEKEKKLMGFFQANEHILWAVKSVGRYNVLAYICTQNEEDFHQTITSLRSSFPEQIQQFSSRVC